MITERGLNRATLARQLLLERVEVAPVDAVGRIAALQAQHPASPYLALWARVRDFDPGAVDRAFADGELVKTTMMRITLHVARREDHGTYRAAMMPSLRAAGFADRRFEDTGLSVDEADALLPELAEFTAEPRTRVEIEDRLAALLGEAPGPGLWRALRFSAPWRHAPGDHPWSFGDPARFVSTPAFDIEHEAAVATLVRRYLAAFGPATTKDVARFTMLRQPAINAAIVRLGDDVVTHAGPGGNLFDLAGCELPDDDVPARPRLLPMWDNVLLAHADRSRVIADDHRSTVIRRNGDVLPTVLVDGRVAGVWRPAGGGIEVTSFDRWPRRVWDDVEREAASLGALLAARDPDTYRRHAHWWKDLPSTEVRLVDD